MTTAVVVSTGKEQAIRLPPEFRVPTDRVYLKRTPDGFLVLTRDPWELFFEGVELLSDDVPPEERKQPEAEARGWST